MAQTARTREQLIKLFLFEEPYLEYEYRKIYSGYKSDKPILNQLINEGLVKQVQKTSKTILFKYIG
jgi:hypothetical protein